MMDELAGFTHCLDLSPGLMQMHWKARSLKQPSCKLIALWTALHLPQCITRDEQKVI